MRYWIPDQVGNDEREKLHRDDIKREVPEDDKEEGHGNPVK